MNIKVLRNVLEANDEVAAHNRRLLQDGKVTAINLISSPGAGKTSLLEKTIPPLKAHYRMAVLEGDIATTLDAERIEKLGVPVVQLLTGGACHLEAALVRRGLDQLKLDDIDLLFIENVGNIACPAEFDLGETVKVGLLSVTEGHDKPAKYPLLFHEVGALVLNKIDLAPYTDFDYEKFSHDFRQLNHDAPVLQLSCKSGAGLEEWVHWIEHACAGELHFEPHTHSRHDLEGVIQPHQHPHRQHHQRVAHE
ncbi:MAG TPA: hydrogenase nickel incorporation protein HypB [Verrucomicrobiae bacterium]|nr:hydrogenase nickel incorporation protein HypB [Verrucomicrobiae bacterium]